ncbi:hypothetical protein Tco_0287963, partial [Tanacetum coccineum]
SLYKALEVSMERDNMVELMAVKDTSHKRRCDDQDPPSPPKDSKKIRRKGMSLMHLRQSSLKLRRPQLGIHLTREKLHPLLLSKRPLHKLDNLPDWLESVLEEERPESLEPNLAIPSNYLPEPENNWANALAQAYKALEENKLIFKIGDIGSFF